MIRVLFADDELMARKRMRRLLSEIEGVEIVAECASGEEALAELDRIDVDLALLDVHMGARSGLEVATAAADLGVEIIFTTAHQEHAVEAFERGAIDYVLKPIDADRLQKAIARVRDRAPLPTAAAPIDRLALSVRGEVRLIGIEKISHAILDGELVHVFAGEEALLSELSLNELERRLPAGRFERVHRRALLSLAHVERLRPLPSGGYLAITALGQEVPVSRQAARAIRKRLGLS